MEKVVHAHGHSVIGYALMWLRLKSDGNGKEPADPEHATKMNLYSV